MAAGIRSLDRDQRVADLAGRAGRAAVGAPVDHDAAADAGADGDHHEAADVEAAVLVVCLGERCDGGVVVDEDRAAPRRSLSTVRSGTSCERDVDGRAHAAGGELDDRRDADPDRREIAAGDLADARDDLVDELLRAAVGGGRDQRLAEVPAAQRRDRHLRATDIDADDRRRLRRLAELSRLPMFRGVVVEMHAPAAYPAARCGRRSGRGGCAARVGARVPVAPTGAVAPVVPDAPLGPVAPFGYQYSGAIVGPRTKRSRR